MPHADFNNHDPDLGYRAMCHDCWDFFPRNYSCRHKWEVVKLISKSEDWYLYEDGTVLCRSCLEKRTRIVPKK